MTWSRFRPPWPMRQGHEFCQWGQFLAKLVHRHLVAINWWVELNYKIVFVTSFTGELSNSNAIFGLLRNSSLWLWSYFANRICQQITVVDLPIDPTSISQKWSPTLSGSITLISPKRPAAVIQSRHSFVLPWLLVSVWL